MRISGENIIGFKESSLGIKTFQTFNPIAHQLNETIFYEAIESEVEEAMELANEAFLLTT